MMMGKMRNNGFTLIEVVIALAVLTIGIIAMFSMQTMGIKGNSSANRVTETTTWAADTVEGIVSLSYDKLIDKNKNGTEHDLNKDGIDDIVNGNFGLSDTATGLVVDADENTVTADGRYNIYWNVAVDHPFRGVKTVQINVVNIATDKMISLQYQKYDKI
jgi:prepilin-type N-terminal cleavage/methylation domain-containing protein